jgi:hypothetical protein
MTESTIAKILNGWPPRWCIHTQLGGNNVVNHIAPRYPGRRGGAVMTAEIIGFSRHKGCTVAAHARNPAAAHGARSNGHAASWTPERRAAVSAAAKRPRRSKNGTPEERAARAAAKAADPETVVATAYKRNRDTHAALRRAAEIVRTLGEGQVRDGWTFDKARGERFLESMCNLNSKDGDSAEMTTVLEWVWDHGQSLEWIFRGDPSVMVCRLASDVTVATKPTKPMLIVIAQDDPPSPGAA